jgi:hypothetical protein
MINCYKGIKKNELYAEKKRDFQKKIVHLQIIF